MARDLYGEILSRVLQRQPPPGHFPAYITSDEAGMLRSQGGGVAPDGGQYMANGLPAFFSPSDPGGGSEASDPGGGEDPGGIDAAEAQAAVSSTAAGVGVADAIAAALALTPAPAVTVAGLPATQATAPAAPASVTSLADNPAALPEHMSLEQQMALEDSMTAYPTPVDAHAVQSARNLSVMQELLGKGMISEEAAVAQLGQSISEGGLGARSPGGSAAINSEVPSTLAQIALINAPSSDPTIGYAINNPQATAASLAASQAFAQVNPTLTNTMFGAMSLFGPGLIGPVASLAGMHAGHGLGSMASDALSDVPGVGALSEVISGITSPVTGAISEGVTALGQGFSLGAQAINEALGGAGISSIGGQGDSSGGGGNADIGGPDIVPVPPVAASPVVPGAVRFSETAPVATTSDIDEATRQRILANIVGGLERTDRPTTGVTAFGPAFT